MLNDTLITVQGNLTSDPEMRYTATGLAVASLNVAQNPRQRNAVTGEWENGEPVYLNVTAWRNLAENICESLRRGDPVTVVGRLRRRTWESPEGDKRERYDVQADSVSVPLDRHTVRLVKVTRETGAQDSADAAAGPDGPADAAGAPGAAAGRSGPQTRRSGKAAAGK